MFCLFFRIPLLSLVFLFEFHKPIRDTKHDPIRDTKHDPVRDSKHDPVRDTKLLRIRKEKRYVGTIE